MLKELFLGKQTSVYDGELLDILRLIRSENIGPRSFASLIKLFGSPRLAIENAGELSLRGGKAKPIKIFSESDAQKELELLAKNNAKLISYKCAGYSKLLEQIADFPPIISYKGNIDLLNYHKCFAIVGARNASINGRSFAAKITKDLVEQGNYVTVSGLARGIDTAVHQAAPNKTIAVIAGGIDHIYPSENARLYEEIVASGGLIIAELPVGSKPLGQHFPQRNRLISGLSLGTAIIEASFKSGSLITARYALEHNREVFAVPGFPLDPRCQGTNKLIREGAHMLESTQDIIDNLPNYEVVLTKSLEDFASSNNNFKPLAGYYVKDIDNNMRKKVAELLSSTPIEFDDLLKETGLPLPILYTIVLEFELAGSIIRYPGNKISLLYK